MTEAIFVDRFARTVLGYHGCWPDFADDVISGRTPVSEWEHSRNVYDWLGHGIYFWEYAPERAATWADKSGEIRGGVIGAIIQLGRCLDLTDIKDTKILSESYGDIKVIYDNEGRTLPDNKGGRNNLDCLVINELMKTADEGGIGFQTIRCPFLEGDAAYRGSKIYQQSHMQLCVREAANILGVFRPNLP